MKWTAKWPIRWNVEAIVRSGNGGIDKIMRTGDSRYNYRLSLNPKPYTPKP